MSRLAAAVRRVAARRRLDNLFPRGVDEVAALMRARFPAPPSVFAAIDAPLAAAVEAALESSQPPPVVVGESLIAGAGRGLFAAGVRGDARLALGSLLAIYPGVIFGLTSAMDPGAAAAFPESSSYCYARAGGVVVDASTIASAAALDAVRHECTPYAVAHMAQHAARGAAPSALLLPLDLDFFIPRGSSRLPYSYAPAPCVLGSGAVGACPPDGGSAFFSWMRTRVPAIVLIALRDLQPGEEVYVDYKFDALEAVPSWMTLVPPSFAWEAHEAACQRALMQPAPRPPACDAQWAEIIATAEASRAGAA